LISRLSVTIELLGLASLAFDFQPWAGKRSDVLVCHDDATIRHPKSSAESHAHQKRVQPGVGQHCLHDSVGRSDFRRHFEIEPCE
jgi:hypothetical protein